MLVPRTYVQESSVIDHCLVIVSPYAITPEQTEHVRNLIDAEAPKDTQGRQAATGDVADNITAIQEKLNKLTKGYLNGLIDEDSYQVAKDE
jgi:hypothetical protein